MKDNLFREERIRALKREGAERYVYIMIGVLAFFTLVHWSGIYVVNTFLNCYLFSGFLFLSLGWLILKDRVELSKLIHGYLIVAPLYNMVIMLVFWNYSVTSYVWLIPIPLGAYVFFSMRTVIGYSLYALIIIIIVAILGTYFDPILDISVPYSKVRLTDILIFTSNVIVITHLLIYRNKIRDLEMISKIEKLEKIELPISMADSEIQRYNSIFAEIEKLMIEKEIFKDPNFNISTLCSILKYSNSYISRAIRYQNYANFNSFLNSYRIDFVVKLIHTTDLDKLTLFFVYNEAGYKNQSTFNRAFKEQKGLTPSEYIQTLS